MFLTHGLAPTRNFKFKTGHYDRNLLRPTRFVRTCRSERKNTHTTPALCWDRFSGLLAEAKKHPEAGGQPLRLALAEKGEHLLSCQRWRSASNELRTRENTIGASAE